MTTRPKQAKQPSRGLVASPELGLSGHRATHPGDAPGAKPTVNDAESPLSWLRTRRDRDGKPLLSDEQFLAGERLRSDFERAMLMRRITTNWDLAGSGGRSGCAAVDISDGAMAARQRFQRAMDSVGPELNRILQHVCCMAVGIEETERALNLPQRSGKAVLGLALTALARHYGLLGRAANRQWSVDDYRPGIPATDDT